MSWMTPVLALQPNDPDYESTWWAKRINLPTAWDYTQGSAGVIIAVIDTGVDLDHPDLLDNLWSNTGEVANDGVDNDHNGFVDDWRGWDFVDGDNTPQPNINTTVDFSSANHGTIIAGLIAARGNNGFGLAGVNWQAKIMPIRVLDSSGLASFAPVINGVNYAVANGADVINISLTGDLSDPALNQAIIKARQAGVVVVTAGGNGNGHVSGFDLDAKPFYPVCYQAVDGHEVVIGVGATDRDDRKAFFSNYGAKCLDIAAPGQDIFSTQIYDRSVPNYNKFTSGGWNGTSFAAPLVSGTAGLIKAISKSFSPDDIFDILLSTSRPLTDKTLGAGLLDTGAAIKKAVDLRASLSFDAPTATNQHNATFTSSQFLVVGSPTGLEAEITISTPTGQMIKQFSPFLDQSGVVVAVGDVTGDEQKEIIATLAKGGEAKIKIFDQTGNLLHEFWAGEEKFRGGLNLATGDVDGDGQSEIITAAQSGAGPIVRIFTGQGDKRAEFLAYDKSFKGGLSVASGDLDRDGKAEIVVVPFSGGTAHVRAFNGDGTPRDQFFAFDKKIVGGWSVNVGNTDFDIYPEIVIASRDKKNDLIKTFTRQGQLVNSWRALSGGMTFALGDVSFDGRADLATGSFNSPAVLSLWDGTGKLWADVLLPFSYDLPPNLAIID